MITTILILLYVIGIAMSVGFMIEKEYDPDLGVWLAILWPLTLCGAVGMFAARKL